MNKPISKINNIFHRYYVTGEIEERDELREIVTASISQADFDSALATVLEKKDGDLTEDVMLVGFLAKLFNKTHEDTLLQLLKKTWHKRHEDIAGLLQFELTTDKIDDVVEAMHVKHEYMLDDGEAFIRKCSYLIGDMKSRTAKDRLSVLTSSSNEFIRKYASYQLERLDNNEK